MVQVEVINQPDIRFSQLLQNMGAVIEADDNGVTWLNEYYVEPEKVLERMRLRAIMNQKADEHLSFAETKSRTENRTDLLTRGKPQVRNSDWVCNQVHELIYQPVARTLNWQICRQVVDQVTRQVMNKVNSQVSR